MANRICSNFFTIQKLCQFRVDFVNLNLENDETVQLYLIGQFTLEKIKENAN